MSGPSPQVCFLRNAQYAVAARGRLEVRSFGKDPMHTWSVGPIASLAAVGEELWMVTGTGPMHLMRWTPGEVAPSRARASGVELPGSSPGRLAASLLCRNAVGWNGSVPIKITAGASTASGEWVERSTQVAPLKSGTWLHASGATLRLQRGATIEWEREYRDVATILEMQPFCDGRSIGVLAKTREGTHRVLVLGARDGDPQQSLAVPGLTAACFVPTTGEIALGVDGRIAVIDLRFRQTRAEWPTSESPHSIAVSNDGTRLVVGFADAVDELRVDRSSMPVAQPVATIEPTPISLLVETNVVLPEPAPPTTPARESPPERESAQPPDAAPHPPSAGAPAQDPVLELPNAPLLALWPRVAGERATPAESEHVLVQHLQFVAALVLRAIAAAWNTGRLNAVADEQPHLTEILGILEGSAARAPQLLAAAEDRVATTHERLLAAVHGLESRQAPITRLAAEFGLSPLATEMLVVMTAPLLQGELARLYGVLANDAARPLIDELLLHQVLSSRASRSQIARELDRDAPLRRFALVHQGSNAPRPFAALAPDPLVLRHLRALPMDADVEPNLRTLVPSRELEDLRIPRVALAQCMIALARPRVDDEPVRLVVRGHAGSGRRSVLAAIAKRAGRPLGVIDASQPSDPAARLGALRAALVNAMLRGCVPCVVGLDDVGAEDHLLRSELATLFRNHPGPLALHLLWAAQPPLDPGYVLLDLPRLLEGERIDAWTEVLARHRLRTDQVPELAARYRIGPGVIERVTTSVASRSPAGDAGGELEREIRQHVAIRLGQLAQKVDRLPTRTDVVLPPDIQDTLLELIARIRQRRRVFEEWGFDRTMTTSRGVTALFQGGPGTGKSMVAGVIARELGLELYRVDLSRVVSKWIGETERNLATIFDAAEEGQCVLLFDEADSLFARRTEVRSSNDRYANLEVNFLLQRLDTFEGIALLTTNFSGGIDRAFKRRLSVRLTFPFPDEELREQLWRAHLPADLPRGGELDVASLARRFAMSGGYIRNAALRAAFLASEEGVLVTQQHLERAVRLEFREIGQLSESGVLE